MPTGLSSEKAEDGVQLSATKVTLTGAFDAHQSAFLCTMKQEFDSGDDAISAGAFRCEVVKKPWLSSVQMESEDKMMVMVRSTKRTPVLNLPGDDDNWLVQTGPLATNRNYSVQLVYTQPIDATTGAFEVTLPTAMAKASPGASLALSVSAPEGWYHGATSHGQAIAAGSVEAVISENLDQNVVLSFTTSAPAAPVAPEADAASAPETQAPAQAESTETPADAGALTTEAPVDAPEEAKPEAEAEETKAEEPKAEEPKAEEHKAEEAKAEEAKAEEAKAEEAKAEEAEAEEAKAEEAKAEEAKAEEAKAEEAQVEEPKGEEAKAEAATDKDVKGEEEAASATKEPERYNKDKADEYVPPDDDDDDEDDEEDDEDYSEDEEESEEEEEATGKYSIDFLMGFRDANTERPEDMPQDLDIILGNDPQGRGGKGGDRRRRKNRRQGGGGGRNGRRDSNDKRDKDTTGPSMLKQSENGWKRPDRNQEGEEAAREEALRKANGILNRLTYENYDSLTKQLEEIAFKDVHVMTGVISLIFDKALSGQKFSKIYAELCDQFNKNAPTLELDGNGVSFLKLLLNKCQEEFENKPLTESVKLQYGDLSDYEIEVKMKARLLSNIKFIGELFLLKMLPTIIVKECVVRLFGDVKEIPPEDDLESLCKLLMTTGKALEKVEPDFSRVVFEERFRSLLDRKDIEPRCKFMIMDLLDLRHNRWVPKRKELVPTTIKEVHAAAKKDEMQQKQKSLTRSADNVGRRGDGRGGDEWSNRRGGGRDRDRGFGKKGGKFGNRRDSDSRGGDKHQKAGRKPSLTSSSANASNSGGNTGGDSGWETVGGNKNQRSGGQKQRGGQGAPGWKSQSDNHVQNREGGERGGGKGRNNAFTALKQAADERTAEKKATTTPTRGGFMSRLVSRGGGFKARPRSEPREEEEEEEKPQNNFSPEEISRKIDSIIEEFTDLRDPEEAMECMKELCSPESHYKLVDQGLRTITKAAKIDVVEELIKAMFDKKMLSTDDIIKGISTVVASLDDIVDDVPLAPAFVGTVAGHMVNAGMLPLILVKEPLATIVECGMAAQMLCTTLASMMEQNDTSRMKQHIAKAGIAFADFAPEKKREDPEALKALVKDDALKAILFEE